MLDAHLVKETGKEGITATPKDDDTFLNVEKGCLFLLTACNPHNQE
jgi:hypothetical protein